MKLIKLALSYILMSIKKQVIFSIIILSFIFFLSNCGIIFYGIEQGIGQVRIIRNSRPISEVMQDKNFPDSLKKKLLLVEEIKKYAIDSLGINNSENYTTVYDQKGKPLVWIVMASNKYEIKPYKWKYPIVGRLVYKGYFKKKKATKEANRLNNKDFDTRIATVSAWSTLGYFKDPILSNMLLRKEGELARLIIHELTHATLYIKGNTQYNENLASFVGDEGAKRFLIFKFGKNSKEYKEYIDELSDIHMFSEHILRACNELSKLYITFDEKMSVKTKDSLKYDKIESIMLALDTIKFNNYDSFTHLQQKNKLPNNTFFVSYVTYHKNINIFEKEFVEKFNSNFKKYLNFLKNKYPSV